MYHSKVVLLCLAAVYIAATVTACAKRRWHALGPILGGAATLAVGIGVSALLNNSAGMFLLSAMLLVAAYVTYTGIIKIFATP